MFSYSRVPVKFYACMSMEQNLDSLGMDRLGAICVGRRRHNEARRLNGVPECRARSLSVVSLFWTPFLLKGTTVYFLWLQQSNKKWEVEVGYF